MDPERFQTLSGRLLHREGKDAAGCRTAIGRCYYAAFHVARQLLAPHFNLRNDDIKEVSTRLDELRAVRNVADYDLSRTDVEERGIAQYQVNVAGEQIRVLKAIASGDEWQSILAEIRRKDAAASGPPRSGTP